MSGTLFMPSKNMFYIFSFEKELKDIGAINPAIYAFGNDVFEILQSTIGDKYKIKKLIHYSHFMSKEKYREHVLKGIK